MCMGGGGRTVQTVAAAPPPPPPPPPEAAPLMVGAKETETGSDPKVKLKKGKKSLQVPLMNLGDPSGGTGLGIPVA